MTSLMGVLAGHKTSELHKGRQCDLAWLTYSGKGCDGCIMMAVSAVGCMVSVYMLQNSTGATIQPVDCSCC